MWNRICISLLMAGLLAGMSWSCAETQKEETTVKKKKKTRKKSDPNYVGALEEAIRTPKLPFVIARGEVIRDCFEVSPDVSQGADTNSELVSRIKTSGNAVQINSLVRDWMLTFLQDTSIMDSHIRSWKIEFSDFFTIHVDSDTIAMTAMEECFSRKSGWLTKGIRMVPSLVGLREIRGDTLRPLPEEARVEMMQLVGSEGMKLEWIEEEAPPVVKKPKPAQPAAQQGTGANMAASPYEEPQPPPEPQAPPPRKFILTIPEGLFVAYTGGNPDHTSETKKKQCGTYLIWNDPAFRDAECDELPDVKFKVVKDGEDAVAISIEAEQLTEPLTFSLEYDEARFVRISPRLLIWVEPVKGDTEGCNIRVDSIRLGKAPSGDSAARDMGFETKDDDYAPKKKKKRKKKKDSDYEIPLR